MLLAIVLAIMAGGCSTTPKKEGSRELSDQPWGGGFNNYAIPNSLLEGR